MENKTIKCKDNDNGLCRIMGFQCPHGQWIFGYGNVICSQYKKLQDIRSLQLDIEALQRDWKNINLYSTFLRQLICDRHDANPYSKEDMRAIVDELEGKTIEEIKKLYKKHLPRGSYGE